MKKTLAILACTVLAASLAGAEEVVSSNTVGYQKIQISTGYTMIGTAFQEVGISNELSVQDIKADGLIGFDFTFETTAGDKLMIWDSASQAYLTTLYYTGDSDPDEMIAGFGLEPKAWFDSATFGLSDLILKNGDAFWILSEASDAKVTIKGEVPETAAAIDIKVGYNMIANPYPKATKVNGMFTCTGLTGFDFSFETTAGDKLMIWDPSSQAYLTTLFYTGDSDPDGMIAGFGLEPKSWFDSATFGEATTEIPMGGAFWIVSSGEGTLTFN